MRRIISFVFLWCSITLFYAQNSSSLQGRIMLNDTVPAAYATIYLRATGQGVVADDEGRYLFEEIPIGTQQFEYSFLGYATQTVKLVIEQPNHRYAHDVRLEVEPIQLAEVYLTPNGEDPATYILHKVAEQAKVNRKRLQAYQGFVSGNVMARDFDLVPAVMPKAAMFAIHGVMRAMGVNAFCNYLLDNTSVKANYAFIQTYKTGKSSNSHFQVTNDSPEMSSKVKEQLLNKVVGDDLFDILYGTDTDWYLKKGKKASNWKLEGVIEEGGKTIDVLRQKESKYRKGKDKDKKEATAYSKLYVIEDLWVIQRYISNSEFADKRIECRDVGRNIYLPVSSIMLPKGFDLNSKWQEFKKEKADSAAWLLENNASGSLTKEQQKSLKEYREMKDSKIYKRIDKALNNGRQYKPAAAISFYVYYKGIDIKP